ncbi:MAG: hypothetical protein KDD44_06425 [Bdellovibrionales bacterium]|nr:hypothetical protein [Bdellovibrionales bacterium]
MISRHILLIALVLAPHVASAQTDAPEAPTPVAPATAVPSATIVPKSLIVSRVRNLDPETKGEQAGQVFNSVEGKSQMSLSFEINFTDGKLKTDTLSFELINGTYDTGEPVVFLTKDKTAFAKGTSWNDESSSANVEVKFAPPPKEATKIAILEGVFHLSAAKESKQTIADIRASSGLPLPEAGTPLLKVTAIGEKQVVVEQLAPNAPSHVFLTFHSGDAELEKDFMATGTDFIDNDRMRFTIPFKEPLPNGPVKMTFPVENTERPVVAPLKLGDIQLP